MAIRSKAINGLYNIECAICGCIRKNNEIQIGPVTGLPYCLTHEEENYNRIRINPPEQKVPRPSNKPVDKFLEFDTPE